MIRQLILPRPIPPTLFELFDDEPVSTDNATPMNRRELVLAAMKSFIDRNCSGIPQREKLTGRRGYGPPTTPARRIY